MRFASTIAIASLGALVLGLLTGCAPSAASVSASSSGAGSDASRLLEVAKYVAEPARAAAVGVPTKLSSGAGPAASPHQGDVTWRSSGEAKGAWVRLAWPQETTVDHIRIDGAGGASGAYLNAVVSFSDGSSVFVTPDSQGNVSVDISARKVTSALLRFATVADGVSSVALRAFLIDDSASQAVLSTAGTAEASTSSKANGTTAAALEDGDVTAGNVGEAWMPASDDSAPWAGFAWGVPVMLASVQLEGTTGDAPTLHGRLAFSDGSSVAVSGVTSGSNPLTTVAFTPRSVDWVRFDVAPNTAGDPVVLGEFRAFPAGTTPGNWPTVGGIAANSPAAGECSSSTNPLGTTQDSALALVCPAPGSSVGDTAHLVVRGPANEMVNVTAWAPGSSTDDGDPDFLTSAVVDGSSHAELSFSTADLPHGPFTVKVLVGDRSVTGAAIPLYVQLNNSGGVATASPSYAPKGMTLQFDDEFDAPLSVSHHGDGATYAATKPVPGSGSEFGGAVLGNPDRGSDTLATVDGTLRLRVEPIGSLTDPNGYSRQYLGGLLSSLRVGGSGFSAQYGYYEARVLGAGGRGSWPAFWMLDSQSAVQPGVSYGEVDAFELYGHNTLGSCHSMYNWNTDSAKENIECLQDNGARDWALTWHTYGVRIRPNGADYYIDGRQVATRDDLVNDTNPYYFMFNLEVDGGWPVQLDPTGGTIDMYVDWVRVYT